LFFSSGAEEGGFTGAEWFLSHPTHALDSVIAYINMEMIGRGARTPRGEPVRVDVSYSGVPPLVLLGYADSANLSLDRPVNLTKSSGGCGSDHAPFTGRGLPAISFQARGDPDYHEITDEARYLNYGHLLSVTRLTMATVERVANAGVAVPRPSRPATADEGC
jgi:Zn-dependent M28 family amino/carboxypeptidase